MASVETEELMYRATIFQGMVVLVTVVLDFPEDKVGQSLAILLELVCIFQNECSCD